MVEVFADLAYQCVGSERFGQQAQAVNAVRLLFGRFAGGPATLPGEVRDVFREWLLRHYPDRMRHVMSLVREARGGRDNDPRFGSRMRGDGPYAVLLQQRFEKAKVRYGLDRTLPALRTDLFAPPRPQQAQLSLF